ncbi:cache domain-containing sensor histidine kinase [Robinsoniella peoriensis]|uniref:cache domain-containing sensor histidine kinase n=1 Tax=Robinsoniella peoriensis TaxID=180332 RepID=UPI00363C6522
MKKLKFSSWFYNRKIWQKLIITFVLAVLLPISISWYVMMSMNQKQMENKIQELMTSQLVQISERVDLTLDIYMNLVYQMNVDSGLIDEIKGLKSKDLNKQVESRHNIYSRLQEYNNSVGGIRCISVITASGTDVTYDWGTASVRENIWKDYVDLRETAAYKKAQESTGIAILPTAVMEQDEEQLHVFQIAKAIYDLDELESEPIAAIVMILDESILKKLCENDREIAWSGINFILDSQSRIITYPDSFFAGTTLEANQNITDFIRMTGEMEDKKIGISTYEDTKTDWVYYNAYDLEKILAEISDTRRNALILGGILIISACFLISGTVRNIGDSVKTIITGIQAVKSGDLKTEIRLEYKDELGEIAENFNDMTERVSILIEEVEGVTEKRKNAEIRALEAQINPHFLYNTLDSINWLAISRGEDEISEMLRNLGIILRYSVNKSNIEVSIAEVADWIDKYISLQQMRFDHAFEFQLTVQEVCKEYRIKKLLIQPFIENALIHGFKGIEEGGMLRVDISLTEEGKHICVIIEDNGNGLDQRQVTKYNDRSAAVEEDQEKIGLNNVFSRIEMYYGEKADWNVISIPDIGTIITLRFPANRIEVKI